MSARAKPNKKIVTALACVASGALGLGTYAYYKVNIAKLIQAYNRVFILYLINIKNSTPVLQAAQKPAQWLNNLPSREEQVDMLSKTPEYDMLIIGGGATGAGVAVDAGTLSFTFCLQDNKINLLKHLIYKNLKASRGLKTALVEKYDFSSGTSSRSTKLIHGGVRYLQKAIMGLDLEQVRNKYILSVFKVISQPKLFNIASYCYYIM